ncbi:hypothetical protein GJ496_004429 [Pomphorhynchus laevis]|nr:hypothetical protein GJ496_004429 [Pomphorhynchus laevis]
MDTIEGDISNTVNFLVNTVIQIENIANVERIELDKQFEIERNGLKNDIKEIENKHDEDRQIAKEGIMELKNLYISCVKENETLTEKNDKLQTLIEKQKSDLNSFRLKSLKLEQQLKDAERNYLLNIEKLHHDLKQAKEDGDFRKGVNLAEYMQQAENHFNQKLLDDEQCFKKRVCEMKQQIDERDMWISALQRENLAMTQIIKENSRDKFENHVTNSTSKSSECLPEIILTNTSIQTDNLHSVDKSLQTTHHNMSNVLNNIGIEQLSRNYTSVENEEHKNDVRDQINGLLSNYRDDMRSAYQHIEKLEKRVEQMIRERNIDADGWRSLIQRAGPLTSNAGILLTEQKYRSKSELNHLQNERSSLLNELRELELRRANEVSTLQNRLNELNDKLFACAEPNIEYLRAVIIRYLTCRDISVRKKCLNALLIIVGCGYDERISIVNKIHN